MAVYKVKGKKEKKINNGIWGGAKEQQGQPLHRANSVHLVDVDATVTDFASTNAHRNRFV